MNCIWVNLKNVGSPFFKFISVYIKMSYKQLENTSQLCGRDYENNRLLLCQIELITNKIKQNYLKQRDLAPLSKRHLPRKLQILERDWTSVSLFLLIFRIKYF